MTVSGPQGKGTVKAVPGSLAPPRARPGEDVSPTTRLLTCRHSRVTLKVRKQAQLYDARSMPCCYEFIGIDPETDGDNCPAVFIDEDNRRPALPGMDVTDTGTLAEAGQHSPIADTEALVRLPARMRAIIMEALNGQGAAVQRADRGNDAPQRCIWRRGTLYTPDDRRFVAGSPASRSRAAYPAVVRAGARPRGPGRRFRRARIVSEPLADYIRFEHAITSEVNSPRASKSGGSPRRPGAGLAVPLNDYWVLRQPPCPVRLLRRQRRIPAATSCQKTRLWSDVRRGLRGGMANAPFPTTITSPPDRRGDGPLPVLKRAAREAGTCRPTARHPP